MNASRGKCYLRTFWDGMPPHSTYSSLAVGFCTFEDSSGHIGFDETRAYGVDADAGSLELVCTSLSQRVYTIQESDGEGYKDFWTYAALLALSMGGDQYYQ